MRKSNVFIVLLTVIGFLMVMAACNNEKSLGSYFDEIFSSNSDRIPPTNEPTQTSPPTKTPEPTNTPIPPTPTIPSPYEIAFKQTLTAYHTDLNDTPIDNILSDFYTYHNERGLKAANELLETEPNNAFALALRGAFKFRQKEGESGFEDSNKALEIDPHLAFAYVNRAWYYQYNLSDLETARKEIETALAIDPTLAYAHCIMAGLHKTLNSYQPMMDSYLKAIELRPDYYVAYTTLGYMTSPTEEDFTEGVSYFEKAIAINPDEGRAYYERGHIFSILNPDFEYIISDLSRAIQLGYTPSDIYQVRAGVYVIRGEYSLAIDDLEHEIEMGTKNENTYNFAAKLIAYTDGDLEKALAYITKAMEISPDMDHLLDTKGYIYYKMGKYDEAFQIFSDLIDNRYIYSYYGRGVIYHSLGENEKAINDFKIFLSAQSGDFRIEEVEKILKELGVEVE
jgi:tetratricopeptide (TPR) repeat protein